MKMQKICSLIAAATFALCAYSARAAIVVGTTTNYSKVSIALTLTTNGIASVKNGTSTQLAESSKMANKDLIGTFADWTTNDLLAWQTAGAQLIYDWNTSQLCVADKTGTNILFYAGNGIDDGTVTAFFSLHWFNRVGPFAETVTDKNPGSDKVSASFTGFFELSYDDGIPVHKIDLYSFSPNTEVWGQAWDMNGHDTKWSDSESFLPGYVGLIFHGQSTAQVKGSITAKGSGMGHNPADD